MGKTYLTVVPAYGRDYRTKREVAEAWANGKDFRISDFFSPDDGRYVSIRDCPPNTQIHVRYDKLRKVTVIG